MTQQRLQRRLHAWFLHRLQLARAATLAGSSIAAAPAAPAALPIDAATRVALRTRAASSSLATRFCSNASCSVGTCSSAHTCSLARRRSSACSLLGHAASSSLAARSGSNARRLVNHCSYGHARGFANRRSSAGPTFHGPNGEKARSYAEVWRMAPPGRQPTPPRAAALPSEGPHAPASSGASSPPHARDPRVSHGNIGERTSVWP